MSEPQTKKSIEPKSIGRYLLFGVIGGVAGLGISLVYSTMGST